MQKVGVRALRDRFTAYLKRVRQGEEIIVTERGRPLAVLKPLHTPPSLEVVLASLEAEGLIRLPERWSPLTPRRTRLTGKTLTELVREEREGGW